jgi:hypothetical protein
MTRTFLTTLTIIVGAFALNAGAQAPAMDTIPAPTCTQPHYPGRTAPETQMTKFNKQITEYQKCMNEYIEGQKKAAEATVEDQKKHVEELNALTAKQTELKNKVTMSIDKQKRHVEARNLAVTEYNNLMSKLKKDAGQ